MRIWKRPDWRAINSKHLARDATSAALRETDGASRATGETARAKKEKKWDGNNVEKLLMLLRTDR